MSNRVVYQEYIYDRGIAVAQVSGLVKEGTSWVELMPLADRSAFDEIDVVAPLTRAMNAAMERAETPNTVIPRA